jgi:hypothetical protein
MFQYPRVGSWLVNRLSIRTVALLVKWEELYNYAGAGDFTVSIQSDAAGPKPGGVVGSATVDVSLLGSFEWWPYENPWSNGGYFWLVVSFAAAEALSAETDYWLCVQNAQAFPLLWARNATALIPDRIGSTWDGAAWTDGAGGDPPYFKVRYFSQVDAPVRGFAAFRGVDKARRIYAAVGPKVMYYTELPITGGWENSKGDFAGTVHQLLEFNNKLFAAQEPTGNIFYTDGTTATTTWTDAGVAGQALAVHDNLLCKAEGAAVKGSTTGLSGAWAATAVTVGDPGTPVTAMVSHGGKLYCAKPEGIFEISYPDTYPGSGTPVANLVLDFSTDRTGRPWLLDWHSGCYFPGPGGVYRWLSGVLTDIWSNRIDYDALVDAATYPPGQRDTGPAPASVYTPPRTFAPVADDMPSFWQMSCGTTKDLLVAASSPYLTTASLWAFNDTGWHPVFSWPPLLGEEIGAVFVQSMGGGLGRLWLGYGHNIVSAIWPTWTRDRTQDAQSDYYIGFWDPQLWMSIFDDGRPHMLKQWVKVGVTTRGVAAGNTGAVYYLIDPDSVPPGELFSQGELLGGFGESPYHELFFPANTLGHAIGLSLRLAGSDADETVEVESVELYFQPLPDINKQYTVTIRAEAGLQKHGGGYDTRTPGEVWAALNALVGADDTISYVDPFGVDHTVRVMSAVMTGVELRQEDGPQGYRLGAAVQVSMLDVATS